VDASAGQVSSGTCLNTQTDKSICEPIGSLESIAAMLADVDRDRTDEIVESFRIMADPNHAYSAV